MKMRLYLYGFLGSWLTLTGLTGCFQEQEKAAENVPAVKTATTGIVADDQVLQFWDSFNFGDTLAVKNPEIGEQMLVNFIAKLSTVADSTRSKSIKNMLSRAKTQPGSFEYFIKQYQHYLDDPNSPLRNDSYYQPVLEFLIDSCKLSEVDRYRYQERLTMVRKNQVGTRAVDFDFQTVAGGTKKLSEVDANFLLLIFYEPDCPNCNTAIEELKNADGFTQLVERKILNILTIYPHGNRAIWKAYQSYIPATWINGIDQTLQVKTKRLYDLKASPTIYLLNKEKKVILKDTDLNQVAVFFNEIYG